MKETVFIVVFMIRGGWEYMIISEFLFELNAMTHEARFHRLVACSCVCVFWPGVVFEGAHGDGSP